MRSIVVFIALFFISLTSISQIRVQGKIMESNTGLPIVSASVKILGSSRSSVSNSAGEFVILIDSLPVKLNISHISYVATELVIDKPDEQVSIRLKPANTTLPTVNIGDFSGVSILKSAWKKASQYAGRSYFGKAFYRQMTTVNDTASEIHELFYSLNWQVNQIAGWKAEQSRYARLKNMKDIKINNPSYLTFLFATYLFNFNNAINPSSYRLENNYDVKIEKYIEQVDQEIIVISCKVKASKRNSRSVFVDAVYYVGGTDRNIYKVESTVENIPYNLSGEKGTLSTEALFAEKEFQVPVLENLVTSFKISLKDRKALRNLEINSSISIYDEDSRPAYGIMNRLSEFTIDTNVIRSVSYDPIFWEAKDVLKRNPLEDRFIKMMESENAFGNMSRNYVTGPPAYDPQDPKFVPYYEKAYLHTDREWYLAGEDIWFKAYLLNAQNSKLFDASKTLYVELLSPDAKMVSRKQISIDMGIGTGDFQLDDSIPDGTYRMRAFTNWMRNFGDNFVFEKQIHIGRPSISADPGLKSLPSEKAILRFFPEGGSMVEGVSGIVAFKVENEDGKGIAVRGAISSSEGEELTEFSSDSSGLGSIMLQPGINLNYLAKGSFANGKSFVLPLPAVLKKGIGLHVRSSDSLILLSLSTNNETFQSFFGREWLLTGRSKLKLYYSAKFLMKDLSASMQIDKRLFPAGINSLTLIDPDGKPQAERLILVEPLETTKLEIATDKSNYLSREKATISLKVSNPSKTGESANLSVSVVDAGLIAINELNIKSYLLLSSELRGGLKNVAAYFDESNVNRKQQLDLLLLTQGWRDFTWKKIADSAYRITHLLERGLTVSGKVRQVFFNKPIANANITMMIPGAKSDKISIAKTDLKGNFYLDDQQFFGSNAIRLNATDNKGKKIGWVLPDTITKEFYPVDPFKPALNTVYSGFMADAENRRVLERRIKLSDTIQLNTVTLTTFWDKRIKLKEETSFEINKGDYKEKYLLDYILEKFPKAWRIMNRGVYFWGYSFGGAYYRIPPVFLVDSLPAWKKRWIDFYRLPVDKIVSVNLKRIFVPFEPSLEQREKGFRSGDNFQFTLKVKPHTFDEIDFHTVHFDIDGYNETRTFYSPVYTSPSTKTDLRTTIYWQPIVKTNANGEASFSFYNADPKTTVRIVAEGISENGTPVFGTYSYTVN